MTMISDFLEGQGYNTTVPIPKVDLKLSQRLRSLHDMFDLEDIPKLPEKTLAAFRKRGSQRKIKARADIISSLQKRSNRLKKEPKVQVNTDVAFSKFMAKLITVEIDSNTDAQ